MKKSLRFVLGLGACASAFALASCDLNVAELVPTAESVATGAQSAVESVEKEVEQAVNGVNKQGLFVEDRLYNLNYNEDIDGVQIAVSLTLSFGKEGSLIRKNLKTEKEESLTYKIEDTIITVFGENEKVDSYYFFYGDIIVEPFFLGCAVRDGVAASQLGTSTIGYSSVIMCNVGDIPAVLTGDKKSVGTAYAVRKNGTMATSPKYIKADQVTGFSTEKAGTYILDIKIGTKSYKCICIVMGE